MADAKALARLANEEQYDFEEPPSPKKRKSKDDGSNPKKKQKARVFKPGEVRKNWVPDDVWDRKGEGRTVTIVAEKECGKSNLVLNLVDKDEWNEVWLVTKSGFTEQLSNIVHNKEHQILKNITEAFLDALIRRQEDATNDDRQRVLIVFDDFIGVKFNFKNSDALDQIASSGRHLHISILFSTQKYKKVPDIIRKNTQHWFFGVNTHASIKQIADELAMATMPPPQMRAKLGQIAADDNFTFMWMKNRRPRQVDLIIPPNVKDPQDDSDSSSSEEEDELEEEMPEPEPAQRAAAKRTAAVVPTSGRG